METGTTIIGLAIAALCIYIFVYLNNTRKKREKKLIAQLKSLATEHSCDITEHELGFDFALGLDAFNMHLFYTKENPNGYNNQFIDLMKVKSCEVVTSRKQVGKEVYINKIELIYCSKRTGVVEWKVDIFDADLRGLPNGEPLMAKLWSEKVDKLLKAEGPTRVLRMAV